MENDFARQLGRLRRQRHLSQEQVASQVFVSRQAISKWEQGETTPDLDTLVQLADLLDVDLNTLVTGESPTPVSPTDQSKRPNRDPYRPMNGWEFFARYWWVIIAFIAVIGGVFNKF